MIHITEVSAGKAALQLADLMDAKQGRWLVNAVDDEGFVLARYGSPLAQRLERSGAPTLAGPFDSRWTVSFIAEDLRDAQKGERRISTIPRARRIHKPRSRVELAARIVELLGRGEKRVADIAAATGANASVIRSVLAGMKHSGTVVKRRDWSGDNFYSLGQCERQVA